MWGPRALLLLGAVVFGLCPAAFAQAPTLPSGGAYVAGIGQHRHRRPGMTITQSAGRSIIDWQGFSIGAGNKVQFDNGSGATLNRVTGKASTIRASSARPARSI